MTINYLENYTFENLIEVLKENSVEISTEKLDIVKDLCQRMYKDHKRLNGDPYIEHAIATAYILTQFFTDQSTTLAAILHDTIMFEPDAVQIIRKELSEEVADIVEKYTSFDFKFNVNEDEEAIKTASFAYHKLLISSIKDIRTIFIRLSSKLHNLKTMNGVPLDVQTKAAKKAIGLYAPLAEYLGASKLVKELRDNSFKILQPEEYTKLTDLYVKSDEKFKLYEHEVKTVIRTLAKGKEIKIKKFFGRVKSVYSIYKKIQRKFPDLPLDAAFNKIDDKIAYSVLVPTKEDCFKLLGEIHTYWDYDKDEFDDYITKPKPNGYSSIQTTIFLENGEKVEIQIKTPEMHDINQYGPASHLAYKIANKSVVSPTSEYSWIKKLASWQKHKHGKDTNFYLTDLFQENEFIFTPKGDVKELCKDATIVDFAYAIHTEIGDHCRGAIINGKIASIDTELKTGDVVEILTDKKREKPSKEWLKFAKSPSTRYKIRKTFLKIEK